MMVYVVFECILFFGAFIFIGYLFILGLLSLLPYKKKFVQPVFNRSFLIAVHCYNKENKEEEITKTLYSLAGLVYPWNLYDFMVIADNCTDDTVMVSKRLGARVLEHTSSDKNSRIDIFHWALEQIEALDETYDAIVFVGPNTLLSGVFLKVMNQYLEEGSVVIQSANRIISDFITLKIKYKRICWLLRTFINALGRKKLGLGMISLGNGICFKTEVLKNNLIELSQMQDNFEYSVLLQAKGLHIDFAPEAVAWSPLGDSSTEAEGSKLHLMIRKFLIVKKYLRSFFAHFRIYKLFQLFDMFIRVITISWTLMFAVAVGNGIINLFLWKMDYISAWLWIIWFVLAGMAIIYFLTGVAAGRTGAPELSSNRKKHHTPKAGGG